MIKGIDGAPIDGISPQEPEDITTDSIQSATESAVTPAELTETAAQENAEPSITAQVGGQVSELALQGQILAGQIISQFVGAGTGPESVQVASPPDTQLLKNGSVGPEVLDMQKQLNEWRAQHGFEPIKEDKIFGPETEAAVRTFQQANGLKDDGIIGPNTKDRLRVENSPVFQNMDPDTKDQIRQMMNDAQADPTARQNLFTIATDPDFAALSRSEQEVRLGDLPGTASGIIQNKLQNMSNEDLLNLAESPGGQQKLEEMKTLLQQGLITPGKEAQLARLNAATFKPAGGIHLNGNAADKAEYIHMVRRDMLASPTFAATMQEINADKAHPVNIFVGRDQPGVALDAFRDEGQFIDLADIERLPERPGTSNPDAISQGEVLSHAMREARQAALGAQFKDAHKAGVISENDFRRDLGQTTFRLDPPNDENRTRRDDGGLDIVIHFAGAPDEIISFDDQNRIQR